MKSRIIRAIVVSGFIGEIGLSKSAAQQQTQGVALPPRGYIVPGNSARVPQRQYAPQAQPVPTRQAAPRPPERTVRARAVVQPTSEVPAKKPNPAVASVKKKPVPPPQKQVARKTTSPTTSKSSTKQLASKQLASKQTARKAPVVAAKVKSNPSPVTSEKSLSSISKPKATPSPESTAENIRTSLDDAKSVAGNIKKEFKQEQQDVRKEVTNSIEQARASVVKFVSDFSPVDRLGPNAGKLQLVQVKPDVADPSLEAPAIVPGEETMAPATSQMDPAPMADPAPTHAALAASEEAVAPVSQPKAIAILDVVSVPEKNAPEIPLANLEPDLAVELARKESLQAEVIPAAATPQIPAIVAKAPKEEDAPLPSEIPPPRPAKLDPPVSKAVQPIAFRPVEPTSDLNMGGAQLTKISEAPPPPSFSPKVGRMTINADRVTSDKLKNRATFSGNVEILSPRFHLKSQRVVVYMGKKGGMERVEAEEGVVIRMIPLSGEAGYTGSGERAVYNPASAEITLTGWPKIEEGGKSLVANSADTKFLIDSKEGKLTTLGNTRTMINP